MHNLIWILGLLVATSLLRKIAERSPAVRPVVLVIRLAALVVGFGLALALTALPAFAQLEVIGSAAAGKTPYSAAVNESTNEIYVANLGDNTVSLIDGGTFSTTSISVGKFPMTVAVNPVTNKAYVTNTFDNTVTVIDGHTLSTRTIPVGMDPEGIVINPLTNKIYVKNVCGSDLSCLSNSTVTIIDGATNHTSTIPVGNSVLYSRPSSAMAINTVTNKIYVLNGCGDSSVLICNLNATVSVIDGATNHVTTVPVGYTQGVTSPQSLAVNPITNKIYVANLCGSSQDCTGEPATVTVINGVDNSTLTVNVGTFSYYVAVNPVTNKIYVPDGAATMYTIDGENNRTTSMRIPRSGQLAVDAVTNKIYVAGTIAGSGVLTMINGATGSISYIGAPHQLYAIALNRLTNSLFTPNNGSPGVVSIIRGAQANALQFTPVKPCRLVDTRSTHSPIHGGTTRSFDVTQLGGCNIPADAGAFSLNVTVVPSTSLGYLTIWPVGEDKPLVSTLNSLDGRVKANAAILPAGYQGAVNVFASDTSDVILDIDGYFSQPSANTYQFYPLAPCRVLDTRRANGHLGGPYLHARAERDFPVRESHCIPAGVDIAAYSLNFTAVPHTNGQPLGYLTVWPKGTARPTVSTLNNPTGTVVANAAIVPAGTGGEIATFAYDDTDLVVDINGYFAAANGSGLSMYPTAPCRVYDSRNNHGQPFRGTRALDVAGSLCAPSSSAQAYIFNATVVPSGVMGYLTLWPDSENQPVVSTLNAYDSVVTSNLAIVPNADGSINAYADGITHLIADISGYFAP